MNADPESLVRKVESVLRDAEGFANQSLAGPARERSMDREVMALAIHEALTLLRKAREVGSGLK